MAVIGERFNIVLLRHLPSRFMPFSQTLTLWIKLLVTEWMFLHSLQEQSFMLIIFSDIIGNNDKASFLETANSDQTSGFQTPNISNKIICIDMHISAYAAKDPWSLGVCMCL